MKSKLLWLGRTVLRRLNHGLETKTITVEGQPGPSIGDRQAHNYGATTHRRVFSTTPS
jgi:hypothetical protein